MNDAMEIAESGTVSVGEAGSALDETLQALQRTTEDMTDKSTTVTRAVDKILAISTATAHSAETVSKTTTEMTRSVDDMAQVTRSLAEVGQRLQDVVGNFNA